MKKKQVHMNSISKMFPFVSRQADDISAANLEHKWVKGVYSLTKRPKQKLPDSDRLIRASGNLVINCIIT